MNFSFDGQGVAAPMRPVVRAPASILPQPGPSYGVGRGWIGPITAAPNAAAPFVNVQGSNKIPAGVGTSIRDGSLPIWWKTVTSSQGTAGQLIVEFPNGRRAFYYFVWTGYVGAQMPVGVGTYADVNPRCTSNAQFSGNYNGDYWTGYGSEDSEARAYNANWLWNILQIGVAGCGGGDRQHGDGRPGCPGGGGCKGCSCGCDRCRHYAWTSQMRAVMDSQGLGHHPSCPGVGLGHVEVMDVPDEITIAIVQRGPVKQSPCDTRWQQADYPPTEGPTDADTRAADAWWVTQVVPTGCGPQGGCDQVQGVGSMEGINFGGRQVQGFAGPPQSQGLGAPTTNASATSPMTVGVVAALGGTVGLLVGAAVGSEIGTGYGELATRRAAVGGLLGMLVGTFTGAAIVSPSIQAQQGA